MNKRLICLALLFSFLLMPSVSALSFDPVVDILGDLGQFLEGVFNSSDARVFVFFILLFIVVYAALDVALSKVKVFEGKDRQRKLFAVGMAFLTDLALFLTTNPRDFVERMITFAGPFGGILLGIICFLAIYKALEIEELKAKWPRVIMALGSGLIVAGMLMGPGYEVLTTIGFIMLIIGIIGLISDLTGGGRTGDGDSGDSRRSSRGGDPASSEDGGPTRIKYNKPNVVRGMEVFTSYINNHGRIDRNKGRCVVKFNLDETIWDNERIQNLEIKILPSRFFSASAGLKFWKDKWTANQGIFPFYRPRQFSSDMEPFEIKKDIDFGKEFAIQVRAINSAGKGKWSKPARLVIGANPIEEVIEMELGKEYELNPASISWGPLDTNLTARPGITGTDHLGVLFDKLKTSPPTEECSFLPIKFIAPPLYKFLNDSTNVLITSQPFHFPTFLVKFIGSTSNFRDKLVVSNRIPLSQSQFVKFSSDNQKICIVMFIKKGDKGIIKGVLEDSRTNIDIKMRCSK